jgi:glutathione synthase
MQILFVADPLESFQTYKDTTYSMMREAQRRGHQIAACEPRDLRWQTGSTVQAPVRRIRLGGEGARWFVQEATELVALRDFDAIVMRKDPPFDSEYFYATHLLEQAEREGAKVFNKPRALRDHLAVRPDDLVLVGELNQVRGGGATQGPNLRGVRP